MVMYSSAYYYRAVSVKRVPVLRRGRRSRRCRYTPASFSPPPPPSRGKQRQSFSLECLLATWYMIAACLLRSGCVLTAIRMGAAHQQREFHLCDSRPYWFMYDYEYIYRSITRTGFSLLNRMIRVGLGSDWIDRIGIDCWPGGVVRSSISVVSGWSFLSRC